MSDEDQENSSLGSVSDHNPLNNLIDDLYYLKCSIANSKGVTQESLSFFHQIHNLLEAQPELCKPLFGWKFLEIELLYFLRSNNFAEALKIATLVISYNKAAPQFYYTKKFLFFITEKLYKAMKGNSENNKMLQFPSGLDSSIMKDAKFISLNNLMNEDDAFIGDMNSSQICKETKDFDIPFPLSDIDNQAKLNPYDSIDMETTKLIMKFITELVSIDKSAITILYDFCFFDLANVCIVCETAEMFNSIYKDIFYPYIDQNINSKEAWTQDGLYEVRRKHFEPEILFRNKAIFFPRTIIENLAAGIYLDIYQKCTNIRDFADIAFNSFLNTLLYKKINYTSQDLESLIIEGKNRKAFLFYRRTLEIGSIPSTSLLNSIIKAVDNPEVAREAAICLYYFINEIDNMKLFTEARIRCIFECLEFQCGHECTQKTVKISQGETVPLNTKKQEFYDNYTHSFDSNLATTQIFGATCENGLYQEPANFNEPKQLCKSVLEDFSEFDNDFDHNNTETPTIISSTEACERKRILCVIKHLYRLSKKEYFFKPSYLILMNYTLAHNPSESDFINEFFRDFLEFCKKDSKNIARALLPLVTKEIKPKKREIILQDDSYSDFYGIKENIEAVSLPEPSNSKSEISGLKVVKNVIESDDE